MHSKCLASDPVRRGATHPHHHDTPLSSGDTPMSNKKRSDGSCEVVPSGHIKVLSARRASAQSNDTEAPANSYLAGASPISALELAEEPVRALVKTAPGPGLELVEIPTPPVGPGDVLVAVRATGICGTDLHIEAWDAWAARKRRLPAARSATSSPARWSRSAPAVTDVQVGDAVSGEGHLVCGRCRNCRAGRRHLCIHTRGIGVQVDGAFAEYVAMPAEQCLGAPAPDRLGRRGDLRPVRQCGAHRLGLSDAGRGRAGHRGRADRHHGRDGEQARRGPARGDHRPERGAAGPGRARWGSAAP